MSSPTHLEDRTLTFILAVGEGERLYPLTADQPKPAVPFGGVFRIIDFTLSNVLNSGLRHIHVLTQYKYERLHAYLRGGWFQFCSEFRQDYGEELVCSPPIAGKRYRGTADAVFQNLDTIARSTAKYVLIVSGDQVYHMDYGDVLQRHASSGADLTIAAVPSDPEMAGSHDILEVDRAGRVIGFVERSVSTLKSNPKNGLVDIGVYVFGKEALVEILRQNSELNDSDDFGQSVLPVLIRSGRAVAFQFGGYWSDPSTLDGYYQASLDLLLKGTALDPYENVAWPTHTFAGPKFLQSSLRASESRVSAAATLNACEVWMSIVSTGARIDAGAELEAAIVLPGAQIGSGAKIRNAIVAEKAVVPPHSRIGYDNDADWLQLPVSENGIVVVGALVRRDVKVPRSISLAIRQ
jgi:glucose-1-phosphate adenylyltransferase